MATSNFTLNNRITQLAKLVSAGGSQTLQDVLDNGNTAIDKNIVLNSISPITDQTIISQGFVNLINSTSQMLLNQDEIQFTNSTGESTIAKSTNNLNLTSTNINLYGQASFDTPPHSVSPILGNDLTTKGYVDSLVGQYSGGFNLYLNYSEIITVNSINYKKLSQTVSSAVQQSITITTNGTNQLIASFISDAINITQIPAGLWNMVLYGGVSGAGSVLYYFFKIRKNSGGVITDLITSGNSPDINATPSANPDAYHMNATIDTPITVLLTDRIIIEVYCIKISGSNVDLTTYFESSYYSYVQTTLNAGTTLLSSNNNWTGTNNFTQIPTSITATLSDNSTKLATTSYVDTSISTNNLSSNAYLTLNTSSLPYTIPALTKANTYYYITGTLNNNGTIRIPTGTTTVGAFINFRNFTNLNLNITGSTFLLYSRLETALPPYILNAGASASFYYNGTIWVQTTTDRTMLVLDVVNQLSVGTYLGDTISTKDTGTAPELYGNLVNTDLNIAKTLPSPYTVRIANTASGHPTGTVSCSNINFNGHNINNATNPDSGNIKLGNSLTSGPLYVGCGSVVNEHTTGPILIGCDSTASGGIGIGLNNTSTSITENTINLGSATYATRILGTLATLGITSASGDITATTGNIGASAGNIIGQILRNGTNTASISQAGVINGKSLTISTSPTTYASISATGTITGSSLVLGTGEITTVGNITSTGTITGSSLVLGTGAITTVGNITSTGAITGSSMTTPSLTTATAVPLIIGATNATAINIGVPGLTTTINGGLTTTDNYYISAVGTTATTPSTGKIRVEVNQGSRTINLSLYNNEVYFINTGTGGGGGGFTLPPVASAKGYKFTFRSVQLSATTEILKATSDGNCILTSGAKAYDVASSVGLVSMTAGTIRTFISDGTFWVQT